MEGNLGIGAAADEVTRFYMSLSLKTALECTVLPRHSLT